MSDINTGDRVVNKVTPRHGEVVTVYIDKTGKEWAVVDWDLRLDPPELLLTSLLELESEKKQKVYQKYKHHDAEVWVNPNLRGKHRQHCLCWDCKNFHPNTNDNCSIANKLFQICVDHDLVTPVYECPKFIPMEISQ